MKPVQFIGDIHGKTDRLLRKLKTLSPHVNVLQLGDMGLGFTDHHLPRLDNNFKFIRGNHDSPEECAKHPNYAGEFGMWEGVFFLGGAYSIDHAWRKEVNKLGHNGLVWWPNEELSPEYLEQAFQLYIRVRPRVVATHEAPSDVAKHLINSLSFREYKLECTTSRTSKALQRMLDAYQPEYWFFGHYHIDWKYEDKGTKFQCLNELAISDPIDNYELEIPTPKIITPESPKIIISEEGM